MFASFPSSWKEKEEGWGGEKMGRKMGRGDDMININGETVSVNRIMYTWLYGGLFTLGRV